ncbi:hypothetical protein lerEdw1_008719 [Lerista edwardsae]|nr:hypothetical protein lerEdw1_008719 [Lerista edwardsae]
MAKDGGSCATCLLCLYSCRWTRSKKGLRTSKCDCAWFFFLFCVCLSTLAWLYLALVTLNDFHNLNEYIFRKTEWWLDWSVVMLSGTATLVTYSSLLLALLILTALGVAAAFVGLEIQWAEQWESAHISLQATGPFLHIGAVVGVTLLAWPVASWFYRTSRTALKVLLLLLYLGAVVALYVAPLGIDSPCLLEHSQLPPQASSVRASWRSHATVMPVSLSLSVSPPLQLAPENTLMSFQKAVDCGVRVFETDVLVSADGVPFLMHDERLSRTTNVKEAFPSQAHLNASTFNWTELQQLDAGSWFLEKRPFPTARSLSPEERALARAQQIPSLEQLLAEAGRHNMSVMFDLRPEEDPQYERLVNVTVETVLGSGIAPELVLWLPEEFREQVRQKAPRFQQVYGRKRLRNETGQVRHVNLPYQNLSSAEIREYRRDNISVNLFVVNAPWLFSVLWCAGTSSVTTNACQVLQGMQRPLWLLVSKAALRKGTAPPPLRWGWLSRETSSCPRAIALLTCISQRVPQPRATYQMIWIVTDCVSFLLISWAFLLLKRWNRKSKSAGSDSVVLLTKIHSLMSE